MANLRIEIPTPCPASWSGMTPNEEGRHCKACDKTVVDFTAMSDEEIKTYLMRKKEIRVCGKFQSHQINPSYTSWQQKLIRVYNYIDREVSYRSVKVVTLLFLTLIMTLSGCQDTIHDTTGDVILLEEPSDSIKKSCSDTVQTHIEDSSIIMGEVAPHELDQK